MAMILSSKNYKIQQLELSSEALAIAGHKYRALHIPRWVDRSSQHAMISGPKNLKRHNWKQVSVAKAIFVIRTLISVKDHALFPQPVRVYAQFQYK